MVNQAQGLDVETDADGFLLHPETWNEQVAEYLARRDGIAPLTQAQWAIIRSMRRHYLETGGIPSLRHVCTENHLDPHCIPDLFHDTGREVWRLAGLPNPGEEAKAYL